MTEWVSDVSIAQGLSEEARRLSGGKVFTFGSYRLGLITPASDIDALCVAPKHVTRESFFQSLQEKLLKNPNVSDLSAVPDAIAPIIKMTFRNVKVDF